MTTPQKLRIPLDRIEAAQQKMGDLAPFFGPMVITQTLNQLRKSGAVSITEAVIADMCNYWAFIRRSALPPDRLNLLQERFSNEPTVCVPAYYLEILLMPFLDCLKANGRLTLGQAFGLEGKKQGSRSRLKKLDRIIRDLQLCDQVLGLRRQHEASGQPISLEEACAEVSSRLTQVGQSVSVDMVKRAHQTYGQTVVDAAVRFADSVLQTGLK